MKHVQRFSRFLTDTVNLNQSRLDDLDARVLDVPLIAHSLERLGAGGGNGRHLLEGEVRWLGGDLVRSSSRVLGECAVAGGEYLIARLKLRDVLADRLDTTRDILSSNPGFGLFGVRWPCGRRTECPS